jgi:hypothetical protein
MAQPIVYVDSSIIRPGMLGQLTAAMNQLARFVETNMPRLISYGFFLDQNQTTMTVVAVHPDSASLEFHLEVGGPEFQKFVDLIELQKIEIYGRVSEAVQAKLHRKAQALGQATVTMHELHAGFAR